MLLSGCIAEGAFRVRGKIETAGRPEGCVLELHSADDGEMVASRSIDLAFQESFVIAPGVHRYYMIIYCKAIAVRHRTETYGLGRTEEHVHPIDLGVISLKVPNN